MSVFFIFMCRRRVTYASKMRWKGEQDLGKKKCINQFIPYTCERAIWCVRAHKDKRDCWIILLFFGSELNLFEMQTKEEKKKWEIYKMELVGDGILNVRNPQSALSCCAVDYLLHVRVMSHFLFCFSSSHSFRLRLKCRVGRMLERTRNGCVM